MTNSRDLAGVISTSNSPRCNRWLPRRNATTVGAAGWVRLFNSGWAWVPTTSGVPIRRMLDELYQVSVRSPENLKAAFGVLSRYALLTSYAGGDAPDTQVVYAWATTESGSNTAG